MSAVGHTASVQPRQERLGLPRGGASFLIQVCVGAAVAAAVIVHARSYHVDWRLVAILSVAGAIAHSAATHVPRNQVFHTGLAVAVAAVLLLPPLGFLVVCVVAHLIDWIRNRYAWYIQTFNIANYVLDATAAWATKELAFGDGQLTSASSLKIFACAAAGAAFVTTNHLLLARMLRLARGHDRRQSQLFRLESMLTDGSLALAGVGIAFTLHRAPGAVVLFVLPLILIQRAAVLPTLRTQARRDPKTGLLNVRGFREAAEPELARARRFNRPLALIMADVDNLREINNTYGHLAGDDAIGVVTDLIRAEIREYDICARFGGDEFVILLPETTADDARAIAARIGATTAQLEGGTSLPVRVSVGVAATDEHKPTLDELLHLADAAMYRDKRSSAHAFASDG